MAKKKKTTGPRHPADIAQWVAEDIGPGKSGLIAEDLLGYVIQPGDAPIDRFIAAVDSNYLDWNPKDPKFQALVAKFFGAMPSPDQWQELLKQSSQQPALIQKLFMTLGGETVDVPKGWDSVDTSTEDPNAAAPTPGAPTPGAGAPPATGGPAGGGGPGAGGGGGAGQFPTGIGLFRVHFKRGTVIECQAFLPSNTSPQTYYIGIGQYNANGARPPSAAHYSMTKPNLTYRVNLPGRPKAMWKTGRVPNHRGRNHRISLWLYPTVLTCTVQNILKVEQIK